MTAPTLIRRIRVIVYVWSLCRIWSAASTPLPTLARTAALLAQDAECLEQMADDAYRQLVRRQDDAVSFPVTQLTALHSAVRLRVLRRAYFELGGEELSFERSQAIDSLLLRRSGGKLIQLPQGINVVYKNKQLIFVKII